MYFIERAWSSGAGRVMRKRVTFADAVLAFSTFFAYRWMKQQTRNSDFYAANPLFGNIRRKNYCFRKINLRPK